MHRLQTALDHSLQDRTDLDDFFAERQNERFFIKNLERVQGDERDAIILSLGITKRRTGQLHYVSFGPLLKAGGERRLNVAITRARTHMTVVSSFDHTDMPAGKSKARGVELLREYLQYAVTRGTLPPAPMEHEAALDAFEADVYHTLTARGLSLQPHLGASAARITFAVRHPSRPEEYVLAIESDGPSYAVAPTASDRDRLRQQQLEQLGWRYHRIWSLDWYQRREQTITRVLESYTAAVLAVDERRAAHEFNLLQGEVTAPVEQAPDEDDNGVVPTREARPDILRGQAIRTYVPTQLVALVRWINSDGVLRTDEELMEELRQDLGFQRIGSRMREVFQGAIDMERRNQKRR
jgi:hypothetical protein